MNQNIDANLGLNFDNDYDRLPKSLLSKVAPEPVASPELVLTNNSYAKSIDLDFTKVPLESLTKIFSGNVLPKDSESVAFAYAGHQFGFFTILGDGRAVSLGEHKTKKNIKYDIQLKGSGKTPYSRQGDGRAALGPVLREYIISEAMFGLGVPTTRCLAVVKTGEDVVRERPLPGAVLTRVASSYIRVGTFQYLASKKDISGLKKLVDYTINRHFISLKNSENPALALLKAVIKKQIELVVNWMRVGFVHGVINTDNVAVSGETIDYGPCAFLDSYNKKAVFSSIDYSGRYSFGNQPIITHWNLLRFAETLLPLINKDQNAALRVAADVFEGFEDRFKKIWLSMMIKKIGLSKEESGDDVLIKKLLDWMEKNSADFTNTFTFLTTGKSFNNKVYAKKDFLDWCSLWKKRLLKSKNKNDYKKLMSKNNPIIIPRNQAVERILGEVLSNNNLASLVSFLDVLLDPYNIKHSGSVYQKAPKDGGLNYKTFCGT